jgi:hypothetical protein
MFVECSNRFDVTERLRSWASVWSFLISRPCSTMIPHISQKREVRLCVHFCHRLSIVTRALLPGVSRHLAGLQACSGIKRLTQSMGKHAHLTAYLACTQICHRKQARRTGMAGPLGQMFDHGCDALNTTVRTSLSTNQLSTNPFCSSKSFSLAAPSTLVDPGGLLPRKLPRLPISTLPRGKSSILALFTWVISPGRLRGLS